MLPADMRMGPVRLQVADADKMRDFYGEVMGLALLGEEGGVITLGAGALPLLELAPKPGARRVRGTTGLFHLALLVPSARALGMWLNHLRGAGWPLAGASDHGVSKALYLSDPEGNGIEVYCDRERGRWPIVGGQLQMGTEPLDLERLLGLAEGQAGSLPEDTRMGHVHLKVADLAACERFYCETLGFDLMQRYGGEASFVSVGGYHHHLAFNIWQSRGAPAPPEDATGLAYYSIIMPEGLAALCARLGEAGFAPEPSGNGWLARDPAGNALLVKGP